MASAPTASAHHQPKAACSPTPEQDERKITAHPGFDGIHLKSFAAHLLTRLLLGVGQHGHDDEG